MGVLNSHLAGSTNSSWAATHLDNYWERNVIYILVAAVLLRLCNALYSSYGVIPYALIKGVSHRDRDSHTERDKGYP